MGHILRDADIGFDLVEEVPAAGIFHGDPSPYTIFARLVELNDVGMSIDMTMERHFEIELPTGETTGFDGEALVDELDGDHL